MAARRPLLAALLVLVLPSLVGPAETLLRVRRVVDGDTLLLTNGVRVRLIGVDTPESHRSAKLDRDAIRDKRDRVAVQALGRRATAFVKAVAQDRPVRLEFETSHRVQKHKDRYGRTLAYVHITPLPCEALPPWTAELVCESDLYESGFLNGLILWAGYGNAYTRYPFHKMEAFRALERDARESGRGLWKDGGLRSQGPAAPAQPIAAAAVGEELSL